MGSNNIFKNNVIEAINNAELNTDNKEKLLFCQENGSLILESSVNSYLKKVAKEVGLSYWKQFSSHKLRHTFATKLIQKQVDIGLISKLLGHSSVRITYDTYIHFIEEQKISAIQAVDF